MTVFRFVFKRFFRSFSNVFLLVLLPLAAIFMPMGEWFPMPMGFQHFGLLQLFIASRLASIIMEDRSTRTLVRIAVAPMSHFRYLGENLLAYGLLMVGSSTVVVGLGKLIHGPLVPAPSLLWMTFSMFSFTAIGFSLAWYSFFQQKETAYTILVGVVTLMVMLGGLMWPVEAMPGFFQRFARLLPTYWLGDALRLSASNASFVDFLLPWGMQGLFAVAFLVMGSMRRLRA